MHRLRSGLGLSLVVAVLLGTLPLRAVESLLLTQAHLLPVDPAQPAAFVGYLLVDRSGKIAAMGPGDPPPGLKADRVMDVGGRFVAPGFLSAHSHIYMSPLRGLGHDQTLYGWFRAWDRLLRHSTAEDVYWFTLHGSLDFLRNGITTAYDFTYGGVVGPPAIGAGETVVGPRLKDGPFEENQLRAKVDAGLRFVNSVSLPPFGTRAEIKARFARLLDHAKERWGTNPLYLKMAISGAVQFQPTRETALLEAEVMREYGVLNQAHFLESPERVAEQQVKFSWYQESGALGPNFIFGHFIQTTPEIVRIAAAAGASMSWQPTSNSRLASGVADIVAYRKAGMKVAVGLDDQSCTDISDPFQNLRIGMALIRTHYKSAASLSVTEMLHLHTLGSAEVLGIADQVGSLTVGKWADFLIVDPRLPDTGPLHDPVATYVLACGLRNLQQVYVGGVKVADGLAMTTADERTVRREVDARIAHLERIARAEEKRTAASGQPHPFAAPRRNGAKVEPGQ
ncbi:MAG: amidohydrolase family protein [Opitutaceae bacterium]